MTAFKIPATGSAMVRVLRDGYAEFDGGGGPVSGTSARVAAGRPAGPGLAGGMFPALGTPFRLGVNA